MRVLIAILRLRPALWLGLLVMLSLITSFTWERTTSYDDGGIGTIAFVVLYTIGLPFVLPGLLVAVFVKPSTPVLPYVVFPLNLLVGCTFYWLLDRFTVRLSAAAEKRGDPREKGASRNWRRRR